MTGVSVRIRGIADVNQVLRTIAPNEAKNLMRATVQEVAKKIADDARNRAPSDGPPLTLKPAIRAVRRRGKRNVIESNVTVDVSAFFWRFLEFGDGPDGVEYAFFLKALQEMTPQLERVYLDVFVRKLDARLARVGRARAKRAA